MSTSSLSISPSESWTKKVSRKVSRHFPALGQPVVQDNCLLREFQKPLVTLTTLIGLGDESASDCLAVRVLYNSYRLAMMAVILYIPSKAVSISKWNGKINVEMGLMFMSLAWMFATILAISSLSYTFRNRRLLTLWNLSRTLNMEEWLSELKQNRKFRRGVLLIYLYCLTHFLMNFVMKLILHIDLLVLDRRSWYKEPYALEYLQYLAFPLISMIVGLLQQASYLTVCYFAAKAWDCYATMLSSKLSEELSETTIHWALLKRQQLEDMTEAVSRTFGWYCTFELPLCILVGIMYFHGLVTDNTRVSPRLYASIWAAISCIINVVIVCVGIWINNSASAAYERFCHSVVGKLRRRESSADEWRHLKLLHKVEILLSKLNHQQIGIYICGIGVLSKSILMLILSVAFSYFFLLIPFTYPTASMRHTVKNTTITDIFGYTIRI